MVSLQKLNKDHRSKIKDYIKELPASLSQIKNNKDAIKNEFNCYLNTIWRHSFYPYGTKKK